MLTAAERSAARWLIEWAIGDPDMKALPSSVIDDIGVVLHFKNGKHEMKIPIRVGGNKRPSFRFSRKGKEVAVEAYDPDVLKPYLEETRGYFSKRYAEHLEEEERIKKTLAQYTGVREAFTQYGWENGRSWEKSDVADIRIGNTHVDITSKIRCAEYPYDTVTIDINVTDPKKAEEFIRSVSEAWVKLHAPDPPKRVRKPRPRPRPKVKG